jgi:hypothetical protein
MRKKGAALREDEVGSRPCCSLTTVNIGNIRCDRPRPPRARALACARP